MKTLRPSMHLKRIVNFLNCQASIVLNTIFAPECSSLGKKKGPGNNLQVKNPLVHKKHTQKIKTLFKVNCY